MALVAAKITENDLSGTKSALRGIKLGASKRGIKVGASKRGIKLGASKRGIKLGGSKIAPNSYRQISGG